MSPLPDKNYQQLLNSLKEKIRQARVKAVVSVNYYLIQVYWEIGSAIAQQQHAEGWGAKTVDNLSKDLKVEFTDMKGLSPRNLRYMRDFANAYPHFPFLQAPLAKLPDVPILQVPLAKLQNREKNANAIVQAPLAQLTWYHHITLLDKVKEPATRLFYIHQTIANGWSRDVLVLQIENKLFERQGKAITNFPQTLPAADSDLAMQTFKSPYVLDFLTLGDAAKERDVERGLIEHLKKFMLELGRGFAYVGNQYNLNVKGDDYFLDLLFYNYHLHCFVVFELKIGEFKPEFAGKLNFYINTINQQVKGAEDKPTIGILLCKTPNETVVKYSLQGIDTPIGVADYKLAKALPKEFKGEIPSIQELEAEIEKEYEELKSPAEKRLDVLKQKLANLKSEEIKITATYPVLCEIFDKSLLPMFKKLLKQLKPFEDMFLSHNFFWSGPKYITQLDDLATQWKAEEYLNRLEPVFFLYRLNGFKKGATETFDIATQLNYIRDNYWYGFSLPNLNNGKPFLKKLYHEQLNKNDLQLICDTVYNFILDDIERKVENLK